MPNQPDSVPSPVSWPAARHPLLSTIGIVAVVFTGVVGALAWLLWVPGPALGGLALASLPVGLAVGGLEAVVFPALVQRLRQVRATLVQLVLHLAAAGALAALAGVARHLGQPHVWPVPPGATEREPQHLLRVLLIYALAVLGFF